MHLTTDFMVEHRNSSYVPFSTIVMSFLFISKSNSGINMQLLPILSSRVSYAFPDIPSVMCGFGVYLKSLISIDLLLSSPCFCKYILRVISYGKMALEPWLVATITTQKKPETHFESGRGLGQLDILNAPPGGWPQSFVSQWENQACGSKL